MNQQAKPSVCVITHGLGSEGGVGRYSVEVINRLVQDYEVSVYCGPLDEDLTQAEVHPAVKVHPILPSMWRLSRPVVARFVSWLIMLRQKKPLFIQSLMAFPYGWLGELLRKHWQVPHCISALGTYAVMPFNDLQQAPRLEKAFRQAHKIFAISQYTAEQIQRKITLDNIEVIPIAVNAAAYVPQRKPAPRPTILSVGTIKHRKGYDLLVKAVKELKPRFPDLECRIVGRTLTNDPFQNSLLDLIEKEDLKSCVTFVGAVSHQELLNEYNQAHVFCLCPRITNDNFEGFGLVFLEASHMGVPVVCTSPSGGDECVTDQANGLRVPQEDPQALAEALASILSDPQRAQQMGEQGQVLAQNFSWKKTYQQMQRFYPTRNS